jgi:hypothetical protein
MKVIGKSKSDWTRSRESWHSSPQSPRVVKLKGLWKRLQVNKQGIAKAKSSLFKDTSD